MRYAAMVIFAYLMIGLQAGIASYASVGSATPMLSLVAVVYIAVNVARGPAFAAGFVIGLMQDLITASAPGLFAFAYGSAALAIGGTTHVRLREHWMWHAVLLLVASGWVGSLVVLQAHVAGAGVDGALVRWAAGSAAYTALIGPAIIAILWRLRRVFAFVPPRNQVASRRGI